MKALVISDNQEIIDSLSKYLQESNYDIIVYRWLLKALDNIEEIQPDLIFLSASEYPRHWKTLASFVKSGIGGNSVRLYLYDPEPLNEDDLNKAKNLGIEAFIDSLSREELCKIVSNDISVSVKKVPVEKNDLIFTHPKTGIFVFCKCTYNEDDDIYDCQIEQLDDLNIDYEISFVSVYSHDGIKSFKGIIKQIDLENNIIAIKVLNYYEEEI